MSIAIAVRASQRTHVPEGHLDYGFKKKPLDGVRRKIFPNIPEEKLHSLNSKVIEFNPCADDSDEDEFRIDDSNEEDDSPCKEKKGELKSNSPCLAYSDIGYSAKQSCNRRFKNVPCSTTPHPCPPPPLEESECTGRIVSLPEKTEDERLAEYLCEYVAHQTPRELMTRWILSVNKILSVLNYDFQQLRLWYSLNLYLNNSRLRT